MNISYRIVGGLSFYQRREIKDILSYLRFVVNRNDEQALKRIINLPKRGIGSTSLNKVVLAAYENGIPLWDVLGNITSVLSGRAAFAISEFVLLIKRFSEEVKRRDAFEAASIIAKESGLLKELYEDKTVEGLNRYENVQELLNAIKEFVDNDENEDKSLGAFLQEVALITSVDEQESENPDKVESENPDKVTLMTIHMAKGLEFPNVFIVGMEEDLFPSQMMLNSRAELEEERRLFYVAITRAQKNLYLSYAISRYRFGRLKSCEPSRFLEDIDQKFIKKTRSIRAAPKQSENQTGYSRSLVGSIQRKKIEKRKMVRPHTPSPDFKPSDTTGLKAGMRVEHPKFGYGVVTEMDRDGSNMKAKVEFENFGLKTLLLTFAKLRIVNNS